jgi:Tfp pilus assembly protein PilV
MVIGESVQRCGRWGARWALSRCADASNPRGSVADSEAGFGLIDTVIAVVVLMVVLIPVSYLLISTNRITFNDQDRLTAIMLADSTLDEIRNTAISKTAAPPPGNLGTAAGWLTAANYYADPIIGSVQYKVYGIVGWCSWDSTNAKWDTDNTAPYVYVATVGVAWGPSGSTSDTVVSDGTIPTPANWTAPPNGTAASDCPVSPGNVP